MGALRPAELPVDEWADNTDVFVADNASVSVDWHTPPRARKPQRRLRLRGELARGDLKSGGVRALRAAGSARHDRQTPTGGRPGAPRSSRSTIRPCPPKWSSSNEPAVTATTFHQLPFALTPGPPVPTTAAAGVDRVDRAGGGRRVAATAPHRAGRRAAAAPAPHPRRRLTLPRSADTVADITAATLSLDSSYLAVHGPPGTGKTHTAARVITHLVTEHCWRIGVVAQSHAAVENVLDCVIDAGLDPAAGRQEAQ